MIHNQFMETLLEEDQEAREAHEHGGYLCCLRLGSYYPVTEDQLLARVKSAFLLRDMEEVLDGKPDLYGPFWIATLLLFLLISSASVTRFLRGKASELDFASAAAGLVRC